MIAEVSQALVDLIHRATPDLAPWVEQHSLSSTDDAVPDAKGVLALIAVEPHPFTVNDPLVEGIAGLVRPPLSLKLHYLITHQAPDAAISCCAVADVIFLFTKLFFKHFHHIGCMLYI